MLKLNVNLEAGTAVLAAGAVIKASGHVPVVVVFAASLPEPPEIELGLVSQGSAAGVLAYLDAWTQVNGKEWHGLLDLADARLLAAMEGKEILPVNIEVAVKPVSGTRRVLPNAPITVQRAGIAPPESSEGGPAWVKDAPGDGLIYARKDGAWVAVDVREMGDDASASGSSGAGIGNPADPSLRDDLIILLRFDGSLSNLVGPNPEGYMDTEILPGKRGWGVDLHDNGKVVCSAGTQIATQRSFSMNMWCKLNQDAVAGVYMEVAASVLDYRFKLGVWPGLIAGAAGPSGWTRQVTGGTVPLDEWFMLTFVMQESLVNWEVEPGTARVYVNGVGGDIAPWWGTSGYQVILGGNDVYAGWHGMLDDVGVWRRALSAGDITALYNGGAGAEII